MASMPRLNALLAQAPSTGSEWVDRAVPAPQWNTLGRVIDPTANGWAPRVTPYQADPWAAMVYRANPDAPTGFAEWLRDYYLR